MRTTRSAGSRAGRAVTSVMALVAIAGASIAPGVHAQAPSTAEPAASAEVVHGWPGTRTEPAGLYSFEVSPGARAWMHRVPATGTHADRDSVELMFRADPAFQGPVMMASWKPTDGSPQVLHSQIIESSRCRWCVSDPGG